MTHPTTPDRTSILGPAALLLGTIVGAGIFALPAAAAASGFFVMLLWGILTGLVLLLLHLMFMEIVLRTGEKHRLPGYVRLYLGSGAGLVALAATLLGASGALLIYLVLFEDFMTALFPAVSGAVAASMYWVVVSTLVIAGIKAVERVELWMAAVLIGIVAYLSASAVPLFDSANLFKGGGDYFLPFGVLLFAFGGLGAIPEMQPFFGDRGKPYARAIVFAMTVVAALYLVFTLTFAGAFGSGIGDDITQSVAMLGAAPLILLSVFGIAAITTSFLVIGSYLVHTLQFDLSVPARLAPLILLLPFGVYLLGARDFVSLVGIVGAVFTGTSAYFVVRTWKRAKQTTEPPEYRVRIPEWLSYPILLLFLLGVTIVLIRSFL